MHGKSEQKYFGSEKATVQKHKSLWIMIHDVLQLGPTWLIEMQNKVD